MAWAPPIAVDLVDAGDGGGGQRRRRAPGRRRPGGTHSDDLGDAGDPGRDRGHEHGRRVARPARRARSSRPGRPAGAASATTMPPSLVGRRRARPAARWKASMPSRGRLERGPQRPGRSRRAPASQLGARAPAGRRAGRRRSARCSSRTAASPRSGPRRGSPAPRRPARRRPASGRGSRGRLGRRRGHATEVEPAAARRRTVPGPRSSARSGDPAPVTPAAELGVRRHRSSTSSTDRVSRRPAERLRPAPTDDIAADALRGRAGRCGAAPPARRRRSVGLLGEPARPEQGDGAPEGRRRGRHQAADPDVARNQVAGTWSRSPYANPLHARVRDCPRVDLSTVVRARADGQKSASTQSSHRGPAGDADPAAVQDQPQAERAPLAGRDHRRSSSSSTFTGSVSVVSPRRRTAGRRGCRPAAGQAEGDAADDVGGLAADAGQGDEVAPSAPGTSPPKRSTSACGHADEALGLVAGRSRSTG